MSCGPPSPGSVGVYRTSDRKETLSMPLRLLLPVLDLAGWSCMAGGVLLGGAALLSPVDGWPAAAIAHAILGVGVAAGLALIGFAANLRLIAVILDRAERAAPRHDGG